jgi:cell division protease FtsH
MGPLLYDEGGEEVFLGRSATQSHKAMSDETAKQIDSEVRRIIDECYQKAQTILEENVDKLHVMADALMLYETIDADQIDDIMEGRKPREPADWSGRDGGSGSGSAPAPKTDTPDRSGPIGGPAGEH